ITVCLSACSECVDVFHAQLHIRVSLSCTVHVGFSSFRLIAPHVGRQDERRVQNPLHPFLTRSVGSLSGDPGTRLSTSAHSDLWQVKSDLLLTSLEQPL